MKCLLTLLAIQLCLLSMAGEKHDTTFLLQEIGSGDSIAPYSSYHAIYISSDVDAYLHHKKFINPGFDKKQYREYLNRAKQRFNLPFKKFHVDIKDREWFPLMLYKGKYYLYTPSDHDDYPLVKLTDSTLIQFYWDPGVTPSILTAINRIGNNTIEIKHAGIVDGKKWLKIHYIDRNKGIVVIERPDKYLRYSLMVEKSKLKNFPVIVNYCKENRTEEWEFENPDFDMLLRKNEPKKRSHPYQVTSFSFSTLTKGRKKITLSLPPKPFPHYHSASVYAIKQQQ